MKCQTDQKKVWRVLLFSFSEGSTYITFILILCNLSYDSKIRNRCEICTQDPHGLAHGLFMFSQLRAKYGVV